MSGARGTLSGRMVLLTTVGRLRNGPYPIELLPGDMIDLGDGKIKNIEQMIIISGPEDAEKVLNN